MPELDLTTLPECFAPLVDAYFGRVGTVHPQLLDGDTMPEPYRGLLVNRSDMTPTLERFHACSLHITILGRTGHGDEYRRQVVLLDPKGSAVEYGAIRIHFATLTPPAREQVLVGRRPLGGVLRQFAIPHSSNPSAFFSVVPDDAIAAALRLPAASRPLLYGRCNTLLHSDGRSIAEVVEILPPYPHPHPQS